MSMVKGRGGPKACPRSGYDRNEHQLTTSIDVCFLLRQRQRQRDPHRQRRRPSSIQISYRSTAFFTAEFIREFPINVNHSRNTCQHNATRASRGVSISTVEHGIRSEIRYAEIITTITTNEHIHITQTSLFSHRLTSISCDDRQHHKIVLIGLNVRVHFTEDTRIHSGCLPGLVHTDVYIVHVTQPFTHKRRHKRVEPMTNRRLIVC